MFQSPVSLALLAVPVLGCAMAGNGTASGTITDTKLCEPQGEGMWTFNMKVSMTNVPIPCVDCGEPGAVTDTTFQIADNTCALGGVYSPPGCGFPATIEENFLTDVLTVEDVEMTVGGAYFKFAYGNGQYVIENNHCGCQDVSSGLEAGTACKCAFPVNGTLPSKREVEDGVKLATSFQA